MTKPTHHTFDIIALGQSFVDFYGQQLGSPLKDMLSFKKYVGAMPAYAMGCARLGLKSALVSQVGKDDMGQTILQTMQHEKVDTTCVQIDPSRQTALMFRGMENQNSFPVIHYSENCADMAHENSIDPHFIGSGAALLVGSSNFFNKNIHIASKAAIVAAKENLRKIILALDYFPISTPDVVTKALQGTLPLCDLIIGFEHDFQKIAGVSDTLEALHHLRSLTNALFVIKNAKGCFVFAHHISSEWESVPHHLGFVIQQSYFPAKEAFISGFIYGWLNAHSQEKCCEFAMATLALSQMRGEYSAGLPNADEFNLYLDSQNQVVMQTMQTPLFEHIHNAINRTNSQDQLFTFSFGHHQQWLKMAQTANVDEFVINQAKMLVAQGIQQAARHFPNACVLTDAEPEQNIIDLLPSSHMLMRSFEAPNEVPLRFEGDPDITKTLLQWPRHHSVKLTFVYHPDDRYALRQQQENTLSLLYRSTRDTGHELLIELAPPTNSLITASTMGHIMQRLYEIGIYPDWWQLSPQRDHRSWDCLQRVIADNDRYCRGVLLLGQQASFEQLAVMFSAAAKQPSCKGFVVGKSLFQQSLDQWLTNTISPEILVETVANSFERAVTMWMQAKESALHSHTTKEQMA